MSLAKKVKLGTLCSVVTKGTTPTTLGMSFEEDGVPFLRVQNISNFTVSLDDILFISQSTHDSLERSKIKPGDFLITIAGTIGRTAIVPDDFPESNCNQAVAILRFNEHQLSPRYLLHWLNTDDAFSQISGKKVTATISNLSLGQIKELEIPLPPLAEQKRIAAILDKADAIRRKRQQAIQLADDFLRAVFLEMFGDPVTNPKGWEVKLVDELAANEKYAIKAGPFGSALKKEDYVEHGYKIYGQEQVIRDDLSFGHYYIDENKFESLKTCAVSPGDVLISLVGSFGKISVVPEQFERGIINPRLMKIKFNNKLADPWFMKYLLTTAEMLRKIENLSHGGTMGILNVGKIKQLDVILPPIELQERFISIQGKVLAVKNRLSKEDNLELFNSLSQKAFSDQL